MREKRRGSRPHRGKIDDILINTQRKLRDSYEPVSIPNLNAFERKRIHQFFDNRNDFVTKTYRNGDQFVLKVFPVGNIKKLAEEKANEALDSGDVVHMPPMGNFERYIIHEHLKNKEGVETSSQGEDEARHVEIRPVKFGRGLKKILKKLKNTS